MERKNLKETMKNYWDNNKDVIIAVSAGIGTVAGALLAAKAISNVSFEESPVKKDLDELLEEIETRDNGRDCLITYSVQDTGEVLWKGLCTESYVEDVKECDMEYETFRKLNGIE